MQFWPERKGGKKRGQATFLAASSASHASHRGFQAQSRCNVRLPVFPSEWLLPVDASAERDKFMIEQRLIDPLQPLGRGFDRQRVTQLLESKTRPRPVRRVLDQPSANRIAEHIAERREKMAVLLNRKTFEPTLPHMPMTTVMPMVATDMAGHPPLHEGAQGCLSGWLYNQMEMVGHEADAEELHRIFGFCRSKQVEKHAVVAVFVKDHSPTIAPIQDMVGVPGNLSAWNTRHDVSKVREAFMKTQE
jgi:hypothetical protein